VVLSDRPLFATIPATDIDRAKRFYSDKLGMKVTRETPGGVEFESGSTRFLVFPTGSPRGEHTLASWLVDDIEREVAELRKKDIVFEEYHLPGAGDGPRDRHHRGAGARGLVQGQRGQHPGPRRTVAVARSKEKGRARRPGPHPVKPCG